jgi:TonB family protein
MTPLLLLDVTVRVSLILGAALLVVRLLARRSAAMRHSVLAMAVIGALIVPVASAWLPAWNAGAGFGLGLAADAGVPTEAAEQRGVRASTTFRLADVPASGSSQNAAAGPASDAAGFLVRIWLTGAAAALGLLLVGFARLAWLSRQGAVVRDPLWLDQAAEICRQFGLRRVPRVVRSPHPTLLAAWGWLRPTVVVPAASDGWPAERIRVVLAHELAHIARADWMTLVAAELLRALHWFNPLAWLVARRLRHESERACDDVVLGVGTDAHAYAEHLVGVARELRARPVGLPAPAMAASSSLGRRVVAMMNPTLDRGRPSRSARALVVTACVLLIVAVGSAQVRSASIAGQVLDETGATVPGVLVTIENAADEVVGTARTNVSGRFTVGDLLPGVYTLTAEMTGFKRTVRTGIEVGSAQTAERDLTLEIGGLEETVEVRSPAGAPPTGAASASIEREADIAEAMAEIDRVVARCTSRGRAPTVSSSGAIRVGGDVRAPRKLVDVPPIYPTALADQGIQGVVILEGRVAEDGGVDDVKILRDPHPGLSQAAVDATSQWLFTPTLLNGCPVPVIMNVTVRFTAGG